MFDRNNKVKDNLLDKVRSKNAPAGHDGVPDR